MSVKTSPVARTESSHSCPLMPGFMSGHGPGVSHSSTTGGSLLFHFLLHLDIKLAHSFSNSVRLAVCHDVKMKHN